MGRYKRGSTRKYIWPLDAQGLPVRIVISRRFPGGLHTGRPFDRKLTTPIICWPIKAMTATPS